MVPPFGTETPRILFTLTVRPGALANPEFVPVSGVNCVLKSAPAFVHVAPSVE